MSWSISKTSVAKEEIAATLEEAIAADDNHAPDEAREQARKAADVAVALADVVGEGPVNVSLAGHANPGHAKTDGYSSDAVSVTVSQA